MSVGIKDVRFERSGRNSGVTEWTVTFTTTNNATNPPLQKREEMQAIGLVMFLAAYNPDLARLVADAGNADPEKVNAVLGLIGCTAEELKREEQEVVEELRKAKMTGGQVLRKAGSNLRMSVQAWNGPPPEESKSLLEAALAGEIDVDSNPEEMETLRRSIGHSVKKVHHPIKSTRGGPCPMCGSMDIIDASQSLDCNGCGHSW